GAIDAVPGHARLAQDPPRWAIGVLGDRHQEVLGGAVLVLQALHLVPGRVEDGLEPGAHVLPARAADLRELADLGLDIPPDRLRPRAELRQQRADDALLLLDQREQQVLGLDLLVTLTLREPLSSLDRLLGLHGELVEAKRRHAPSLAGSTTIPRRSSRGI